MTDAMQIMRRVAKVNELEAAMRDECVRFDIQRSTIPANNTNLLFKESDIHREIIHALIHERHEIIVAMCHDCTFAASGLSWDINWGGVR